MSAQSVDEQITLVEESLDKFEERNGLLNTTNLRVHNQAQQILNMSREELEQMNPEDCGYSAWTLYQYSWHIQRLVNREQSKHDWCHERILKITADTINQVKGYTHQEKLVQAINQNDAARKLKQIMVGCKSRVTRLSYLSLKLESMAKCLSSIKQRKQSRGE